MASLARVLVEHVRIEERAYVLVISFEAFQNQKRWDDEEDLCLSVFQLLGKRFMFLSGGFDHRTEVDQLMAFLMVHEVGETLRPGVLEFYEDFYELDVVLELRVYHLDVLLVLFQELPEVRKCLLDLLSQDSNGF